MNKSPCIYVALPALDEQDSLPNTIECILKQNYNIFKIFVVVNQPDDWWEDENKKLICLNNQNTLKYLASLNNPNIHIIDKSSKGSGWKNRHSGVGIARKTVMDKIIECANNNDIIVSTDADTTFNENYFQSIINAFNKHTKAIAVSSPYYHNLSGDKKADRAILRYEIYMRYYALNLWRIASPYNFTALGSAIAVPVKIYKTIGGMTPKKGGEDFYFLQKLRNYGEIITYLPEKVYPQARFSDRVDFGTGPAMIKGAKGDWQSYPIYNYLFFDEVYETYKQFENLYHKDINTTFINYINKNNKNINLWQLLRNNYPNKSKFIQACHTKVNALRILQYLKFRNSRTNSSDEGNLINFLKVFFNEDYQKNKNLIDSISFDTSTIDKLNFVRNFLANKEEMLQKNEIIAKNGKFIIL